MVIGYRVIIVWVILMLMTVAAAGKYKALCAPSFVSALHVLGHIWSSQLPCEVNGTVLFLFFQACRGCQRRKQSTHFLRMLRLFLLLEQVSLFTLTTTTQKGMSWISTGYRTLPMSAHYVWYEWARILFTERAFSCQHATCQRSVTYLADFWASSMNQGLQKWSTVNPWRTQVGTTWVHLYADFSINIVLYM